jgi:ParB-like nuclease domain
MITMTPMEIQTWSIDKLVPYARNPRKNDSAVDRMVASIREYGFKIPVLARSDGEVIDGHLRLKAAHQLGIADVPVVLCDEWTPVQVKAFRLMVNRSVTWADWNEELLAQELEEIRNMDTDFDLDLTGFDIHEIDDLLIPPDDDQANAVPSPPTCPVTRPGDLWLCGDRPQPHRVLCGDATSPEAVARLLDGRKPPLLVSDPPYGIQLDSEWRDRAGLNGHGAAEPSYMKRRTKGHTETSISGDTRADWSEAFALAPSLEVAYVWHASVFTREVLDACCESDSFIRSRLSGIKAGVCSREHITGTRTSRAGMSGRRMRHGSGRQGRTRPSGIHHHPSSSWGRPVKRNSTTPRRSLWN